MGFGVDLDRDKPAPAASSAPALTYRATDGTELPVDERAPSTARERALARGLLLHALSLLDAADRP
jgi:hypothetical protein